MRTAIVTYDNGHVDTVNINGTDEEIREYFKIGRYFNLGNGELDLMAKVYDVEIIQESRGMENMTKEEGRQIIKEILTEAEGIER